MLTRIKIWMLAVTVLWGVACASKNQSGGDRRTRNGYTMAGYEFMAKGETYQRVVSRYGQPTSESSAGTRNQYRILSYPVSNGTEKLLVAFCGEEFLGSFREAYRESMNSIIRSHERSTSGRIVLLSAWSAGKTTVFSADEDFLKTLPKWHPKKRSPAPISEAEAEAKAAEWMQINAPTLIGNPKVSNASELPSMPGVSYYAVSLGIHNAPQLLQQVLVLMDGSVVSGKIE